MSSLLLVLILVFDVSIGHLNHEIIVHAYKRTAVNHALFCFGQQIIYI